MTKATRMDITSTTFATELNLPNAPPITEPPSRTWNNVSDEDESARRLPFVQNFLDGVASIATDNLSLFANHVKVAITSTFSPVKLMGVEALAQAWFDLTYPLRALFGPQMETDGGWLHIPLSHFMAEEAGRSGSGTASGVVKLNQSRI